MSASPSVPSSKPEGDTQAASSAASKPAGASPTVGAPSKPALEVKAPETADDKIARAKAMNDRFKRRGKRTAAAVDPSAKTDGDASTTPASKKTKSDDKGKADKKNDLDDEYLREVQGYMARSLKDEGAGKRPLVR